MELIQLELILGVILGVPKTYTTGFQTLLLITIDITIIDIPAWIGLLLQLLDLINKS